MESVKVISIKEIVHWSCHILEHKHRTKEVAEKCMQQHGGESDFVWRRLEKRLKWCEIAKKVLFGMRLNEAAEIMNVSVSQARVMFFLTLRRSTHPKYQVQELKGARYHPIKIVRVNPDLWARQVDNYAAGLVRQIDKLLLTGRNKNDSEIEA